MTIELSRIIIQVTPETIFVSLPNQVREIQVKSSMSHTIGELVDLLSREVVQALDNIDV
jgi:hypothetical protein